MPVFPWRWRLRARHPSLLLLTASGGFALTPAAAEPVAGLVGFESSFMHQSIHHDPRAGSIALDNLAMSSALVPGVYPVELLVNLDSLGQQRLAFSADPHGHGLQPCLPPALVESLGLRADRLARPADLLADCVDLPAAIPGAQVEFDAGKLQVLLSVPQIALRRDTSLATHAQDWSDGINAAFLNYQVSAYQGHNRFSGHSSDQDLNLDAGVNLGPWRLRSNQALRRNEQGAREWTRAFTYVQRDLPGTYANLTLGETFTQGDMFRSVPIKGLLVASDLGMLSDQQQSYAPSVRGVAYTRAKLEIRQNGYPIYSTYVSPGPYQIDDLSTGAGSGELEIVLTEADGQVRRFTQPYSTLGNLLRDGVWRYSAALGRYNAVGQLDDPLLWQGTLAVGGVFDSTLYGGLMASDFYRAGNLGLARDLGGWGALAADLTHSSADIDSLATGRVNGLSYALKYGKSFTSRTNLRFAGYRYSTEGYRDFDEALRQRSHDGGFRGSRRSRLEAVVYQNIGGNSALNLSLSQQDYWRSSYQQRQFQFNFNTQHRGISYNLFASQSLRERRTTSDRQVGLSVTLPLDLGRRPASATFDVFSSGGRASRRASLNGRLHDDSLNYRLSLGDDQNRNRSAALAVGYQSAHASLGAGYSQGNDYRALSLNANGALLLHAGGLTPGHYLGETTALVEVPGVKDVGVLNSGNVRTDGRGYALLPYLRPYRSNQIVLDTDHLGPEVEIANGATRLVPRRGAVVKASFEARSVDRLVLTLHSADRQPLPFGAQVSNEHGEILGIVAQAGQVMLSTARDTEALTIRWGAREVSQCRLPIDTRSMASIQGYRLQSLTCQ
ncbi:fimbria/pilus outer membrane usher protein [Pseudomonas japonica]|uniref:Outer membrane usher protein n=1 Tax=Pseudomonas japonica TaxID=256466 RepID=A0A239GRN9_9PSED|nr:fimbria/pilus outer membrane usher protein [Pseudomonas japonica]SNS71889.1 outer membrane usher protein [Pseudomonas japonica]